MDGRFLDNNGEEINIVCHGLELSRLCSNSMQQPPDPSKMVRAATVRHRVPSIRQDQAF